MDIQIPSSLERLIFDLDNNSSNFYESLKENNKASLSEESIEKLQHVFSSQTFDDEDIKDEIKLLNEKFEIVFDPQLEVFQDQLVQESSSLQPAPLNRSTVRH